MRRPRPAFTLLEVIVGIGVFALGMLTVIGLFAPIARSVATTSDGESAARVGDALRAKLQTMPFAEVAALLKKSTGTSRHELTADDAKPDYNPAADVQILFANRDGSKVGVYSDPVWRDAAGRNSDREKYFEIALIRNESISPAHDATPDADGVTPPNPDDSAFMLGYIARIRWPSFISDGGSGTIQVGANTGGNVRFDHGSKQVLFVAGSITR